MAEPSQPAGERIEIHVPESETRDLAILSRSDLFFAVLYGLLFIWGLVMTLLAV